MFTRLNRWLSSFKSRPLSNRPQARRTRPRLEVLEDRLAPAILSVNSLADSINLGDNFLTLREAIACVNAGIPIVFGAGELGQVSGVLGSGDEIRFDPSLRGGTITLNGTELAITRSVSITGPGGTGLTISGNNASRLFNINDGNGAVQQVVSISDLNLTGGNSASTGGAISNQENLTLTGCTLFANVTSAGGGAIVGLGTSSLTVVNSTFSGNNAAVNGGALLLNNSSRLTAIHSTFALNKADSDNDGTGVSGAIARFTSATVTLHNCLLGFNTRGSARDDLTCAVQPESSNNIIHVGDGVTGITHGTQGNQIGTNASTLNPEIFDLSSTLGGPTSVHAPTATSRSINSRGGSPFLVNPLSVTSSTSATDFSSVQGLIGNTGLSPAPTIDNLAVAHAAGSTMTGWVTESDSPDYFSSHGPVTLTFALGGTFNLTDLVLWGFDFNGDGPDNNEAKTFEVRFSSTGGASYHTTVPFTRAFPSGLNADILPIGSATANFVQIVVFDNFFGREGGDNGGDRVGLSEVKFLGRPAAVNPFLITPTTSTSNTTNTDANSVKNLIDNGGLSAAASLNNVGTVTHAAGSTGTVWTTTSVGSDYFSSGTAPVLTFALGGTYNLTDLVVWGADFNGDGPDDNNEARTFQLEFSTDGGATFSAPTTITQSQRLGQKSGTRSLGTTVAADVVRVTVTDNFFGVAGGTGGDRVAVGELKFVGSPATDQRGFARVQAGIPDYGSVEIQNPTGNTIVVDSIADEQDGILTANRLSLREAIAIANERPGPDTITFAPGVNLLNLTFGQLLLTDPARTTIEGNGRTIQRSSVFGTGRFRIFEVVGGSVDFNDLTISNGAAVSLESGQRRGGGGILNRGGTVTLTNTTLSQNSTTSLGGGLSNFGGTVTLTDSTVRSNTASFFDATVNVNVGGGIFNDGQGTVNVATTLITANTATGDGGGIANAGVLNISSSSLTENQSTGNAGGAIFNTGTLTLTGSNLGSNVAAKRGGALRNAGSASVANAQFQSNRSDSDGGGAIDTTGALTVSASGFAGSTAVLNGGALAVGGSASVRLINSTFSFNAAAGSGGAIHVGDTANLTVTHVTIVLNRADSDDNGTGIGGGLSNASSGSVTLNNTIVAGNLRGGGAGSNDDLGATVSASSNSNLIGDPSTAGGLSEGVNGNRVGNGVGGLLPVGSIINTTLSNNGGVNGTLSHSVVPNSRALNAGNNSLSVDANGNRLSFDQRGPGGVSNFVRHVGTNVEIGAIEYIGPNQAPVNNLPATKVKLKKNRLFTFNGMLSVSDLDAGAGTIQVSIAVTKGKLLLTSANGVGISGSNSKTITLTGALSAVNAALAALQYKPNPTYIGGVKLTMTTSDQGNSGDPLSDVDVLKLGLS